MRATLVIAALLAAAAVAPAAGGGTSLVHPAWLAPLELTPRSDYSIFDQSVAVDVHDNALAVWSENRQGVFASYRPAGNSWQAATMFDACGIEPQADFDGAGNATVVWLECAPAFTRLAVAERHVDGSWTPPTLLSTPGRSIADPHLEATGSGAAVISWIENDGHFAVVEASAREPVPRPGSRLNRSPRPARPRRTRHRPSTRRVTPSLVSRARTRGARSSGRHSSRRAVTGSGR